MLLILFVFSCTSVTSPELKLNQPGELTLVQSEIANFKLEWTDDSINEDGYKVLRKLDDGAWELIAELLENTEQYQDEISISSQTFNHVYYRIYSYKGNSISDFAEIDAEIVFPAPTDLELNMTYWILSWTDNTLGEDGFVIERSVNNGGFVEMQTTVPNINGTILFDLDEYNNYAYRVYAFVGGFHSDYSNLVQFSTTPGYFEADFVAEPLTGDSPLRVYFTDISIVYFPQIISWEWDFGNGQTSDQKNPSVLYLGSGSYTVSLTVTNEDNGIDTMIKVDYIIVD